MKVLFLNQAFYPDCVATAQYLTELALGLVERGHDVSVIAGRYDYDQGDRKFVRRETWRGIEIYRAGGTRLGKSAKWRRGLDFASFVLSCAWRLWQVPRHDVVVALTSPPLICVLAALLARWQHSRFVYWVMDLNPDEAVAAGWLRQSSLSARFLEALSCFSLRQASRIVVLDRFVKRRILSKRIPHDKVVTIPTWSLDDAVRFDRRGRELFRRAHGWTDRFVVMYSGNHSPCHPLDALQEAARALARSHPQIVFVFVGGGSEWRKVQRFAEEHRLSNIRCLPYQPLDKLAASLSAADVQVVAMGELFVGIVHPCKIYNILQVGAPVLYLGPKVSHISELLQRDADQGSLTWGWARPRDTATVVRLLAAWAEVGPRPAAARAEMVNIHQRVLAPFSKAVLLPQIVDAIAGHTSGSLNRESESAGTRGRA